MSAGTPFPRCFANFFAFVGIGFVFSFNAFAQSPACVPSATAATLHAEGLAERIGDIVITCTGGNPGSSVAMELFVTLNANITNRLDGSGNPLGISVTGGAGSVAMSSPTTLILNPLTYTVPTPSSAPAVITLSGIRVAVAGQSGTSPGQVTASFLGIGATFPPSFSATVGTSMPSLQASLINNGIPCSGSALPSTLDFPTFASTTVSSAVRITEASPGAFTAISPGADSGLRIRVNLSGYGAGTRVFIPDAIVGNSGAAATTAGAFGTGISGGAYTPGAGQLLLARVNGADATGALGTPAFPLPMAATSFTGVTEVVLANGAASIVYEVLDSNLSVKESAQIPVFVVSSQTSCPGTLTPQLAVAIAPVSSVAVATPNLSDAIPRFVLTNPMLDCQQDGDCTATYFPSLSVNQTAISLLGTAQGDRQSAFVPIGNTGTGVLNFTTSIAYQSGSGWLSVNPASGAAGNLSLQVIADPASLGQGTYTATLTISAGQYGTAAIPVTFTVGPLGVVIQNVGNAASFTYGTVAPGSYAVLFGLNLSGTSVGVTFNGLPATIVFRNATQINLIVPPALGTQQAASVVVTADGLVSNSFKVDLILNSPGIFSPGIINYPDGSVNDATHPAARGGVILIFFTGLAIPVTGQVTVNIGNQTNLIPSFAGAQPTLPALDQVNINVPSSLLAGTASFPVQVCIPGSTGQQVCSNQVNVFVQ